MRLTERLRYVDNDLWLWIKVRAQAGMDRAWLAVSPGAAGDALDGVACFCNFVGYPRSGHSLVSSILDAHPQAAFSHRLDAVKYIARGAGPRQVFHMIVRNAQRFAARGRRLTAYAYAVPGQWQGRGTALRVVGDQEAHWATLRLRERPDLLERFAAVRPFTLRFLHVVRNPYDNITTWANRRQVSLGPAIRDYFALANGVAAVKRAYGEDRVLDLHHEEMIDRPADEIRRLCAFLSLDAPDEWVESCTGVVYARPNRTRDSRPWPDALVREVADRAAAHPFLARYTFES
jgi:hypothetical protein